MDPIDDLHAHHFPNQKPTAVPTDSGVPFEHKARALYEAPALDDDEPGGTWDDPSATESRAPAAPQAPSMSPPASRALSDPAADSDVLGPTYTWNPSIDRLVRRVSQLIRWDVPGATIYGVPRVGKSCAIHYMLSVLPDLFGGALACAHMSMANLMKEEKRDFLLTFMYYVGCRNFSKDNAINRARLVEHLQELAERKGTTRIVVVLDEAQLLSREHYRTLITIYNNLVDFAHLRPFFLLVGQVEIQETYSSFSTPVSLQELGRFFNVVEEFAPIRGPEIESVLEAMDTDSADGQSHGPRYLLAKLYATGFELKQMAPAIDDALQDLGRKHKMRLRISMQHLRSLVIYLVQDLCSRDGDDATVSTELVISGLENFGFLRVMRSYAEP